MNLTILDLVCLS